jgi:hypothetical protein
MLQAPPSCSLQDYYPLVLAEHFQVLHQYSFPSRIKEQKAHYRRKPFENLLRTITTIHNFFSNAIGSHEAFQTAGHITSRMLNNVVSRIRSPKDNHGVIDLLEEVSKNASCFNEEERKELGGIAQSLRYKHSKSSPVVAGDFRGESGKDVLRVDLLKDFPPSLPEEEATDFITPSPPVSSPPHVELLRGFSDSPTKYDSDKEGSNSGNSSLDGSGSFEKLEHL